MSRNRSIPKGVNLVLKTLKDGSRVQYGYYGRGAGAVALGRVNSPEFHERLAAAMRRAPPDGTVSYLVWQYKQSPEFKNLAARTRKDYLPKLDRIQKHFGRLALTRISSREFIPHIYKWRDTVCPSPRQADYHVQVLSALLGWAQRRGLIESNRAKNLPKLYKGNRSEITWTDDQVKAFLASAPEPLRRALILALETAQREGDLLILPWSADKGDYIELRTNKTKVPVAAPMTPLLRRTLDEAREKAQATTILTRADGLPWDRKANGFRAAWRDACKAAGVTGVTFNDLRGTAITRMLAADWSREEVAAVTGHSLRNLAMLDVYTDRKKFATAAATRRAKTGRGGEA
jgi:integrase